MDIKGAVAAGHPLTTSVAKDVLSEGGNAFDAVVAAFFMACVAEPVLASLGGGGFLLASHNYSKPFSIDFFVHTPGKKKPTEALDFEEVLVDFGNATQAFHMGNGTVAVPGCVKGIFEIHQRFCRMPMRQLIEPAANSIRQGISITKEQADILQLVSPIYVNRQSARELFVKSATDGVLKENQHYQNHDLADVLETLAAEGLRFFYHGEIAEKIEHTAAHHGGSVTRQDLLDYNIYYREPIQCQMHASRVYLNPPPSAGGMLVHFASELLLADKVVHQDDHDYYGLLANVMALTQQARVEALAKSSHREIETDAMFSPENLSLYRQQIVNRNKSNRGTTHVSVADAQGNIAALTVSNGEGCGEILPNTGIMLNNMLGEDDLNPLGLNRWQVNRRLSSMMCPGIAIKSAQRIALGSGGSNRIRTAVLQVLLNKLLRGMPLQQAVQAPRLHFDDRLYLEAENLTPSVITALADDYADMQIFPKRDFYFGGVNAVAMSNTTAEAFADPRRGGAAEVVRR